MAAAFITEHLTEPLSVERISMAAGLSPRTLRRAILREYGVPPMTMVRHLRLDLARIDLQAPTQWTTVTSAALDRGFTHLGRFSQDYARRFGELPSYTLRRARVFGSGSTERPAGRILPLEAAEGLACSA